MFCSSAAKKLTGFERLQFQAEMATKSCGGSAKQAEAIFRWCRGSVSMGLNEMRTGIRCVKCFSRRGRKKTEGNVLLIKTAIQKIVEPQAQARKKDSRNRRHLRQRPDILAASVERTEHVTNSMQ